MDNNADSPEAGWNSNATLKYAEEPAAIGTLLAETVSLPAATEAEIISWAQDLRASMARQPGIESFLSQFGLASAEGIAVMCLAEALLRIPDQNTADQLLQDKLGDADWQRHIGSSPHFAINAASWALALTGDVLSWRGTDTRDLLAPLRAGAARLGLPVIRAATRQAMRLMAEQFVLGADIEQAVRRAAGLGGWLFSFDMLGEAARTATDAARYADAYAAAIQAVAASGLPDPAVSIKLSALHPRYEANQHERVRRELLPRLLDLCRTAAQRGVAVTLDAEEADRLDLSLTILAAVARDLSDWPGLGCAVQAYGKRAAAVVSWLDEVAIARGTPLSVRLVKGAYWDSEIKWAQERGHTDYPVWTRKEATDLNYRRCVQYLFAARALRPQFATHNPRTVLEIRELAAGRPFELQKLHGMGDALYAMVRERLPRVPVRIYAPVGPHHDLLPYLVRRLLENGANSSFIHQIADPAIDLGHMTADPAGSLRQDAALLLPRPPQIFPGRRNSRGFDLSDPRRHAPLLTQLAADRAGAAGPRHEPADQCHALAEPPRSEAEVVPTMLARAADAFAAWNGRPVAERAACLERAADMLEAEYDAVLSLIIREGGKTIADAVAEIREAIDFARYYALEARRLWTPQALPGPTGEANRLFLSGRGVFACISPWNFPLAITMGQMMAALVAGNCVIAKPAEQTPLIAQLAVCLLHRAGVPEDVLHLLHGRGSVVGPVLTADPRLAGVAFTGSTATAQQITRSLASRNAPLAALVAETGGVNALVADSSALPEALVQDVIISAFQSAGQRCSALRVLFVQADIAPRVEAMLAGAMQELRLGDPADPATDIGPVIDGRAQQALTSYAEQAAARWRILGRVPMPADLPVGYYVPPLAVSVPLAEAPTEEVFGPILHVVRWHSDELPAVISAINRTGYALTLGVHSRIQSFVDQITATAEAGNIYVNRTIIGAVVGAQPFGGHGLSGTGPKAGGPHYLLRFAREQVVTVNTAAVGGDLALVAGSPLP